MTFGSTFGRVFSPTFQPSSQVAAAVSTFVPTDITGCALWLDFADVSSMFTDDGTTNVSTNGDKIYRINDKSGNSNHARNSGTDTTRPTYLPNTKNGKSVGRFTDSAQQMISWTSINTIRTVFWMFRAVTSTLAFSLGHATAYHFHSTTTPPYYWYGGNASTYVRQGNTRVNGQAINHETTIMPSSLSVCSLVTTGNVSADNFSRDRTQSRWLNAELGELIIYTAALSDTDRGTVETYLNNKWAIY